jgi:hypothetical protein
MALQKIDSWALGDFFGKGGWATVADSTATAQMPPVARAQAKAVPDAKDLKHAR